jgi:cation:H+ antiporter
MLDTLLQFGGTAAVIVVAGSFLTRFTDRIAHLTGLGRTLAGMLLLAVATSLPETTIGANAALIGAVDLTAGDVLGSSLMNLLILAVLDLTHYSRGRMLSYTAAAHALGGGAAIIMTALVLLFLLVRPGWSLFGWVGVEAFVLIAGCAFCIRLLYAQQRVAATQEQARGDRDAEPMAYSLRGAIVGYLVAAAAIFVAAPFLARSADRLAEQSGLGGTFVGTTLVALSTSLPEVVTTFAAVRRGAFDLAIGNIFGSNVFNMVILAGVDLFQAGPLFGALSPVHAMTAAWVILITAVAVMGQLYHAERRYWLLEPDAALVILLILIALSSVYVLGSSASH